MLRLFYRIPAIRSLSTVTKNGPVPIVINEEDLEEKFVKGHGNGGQKVNKTSNCVQIVHIPTGIRVSCHANRSLNQNRSEARRILRDKLDEMMNGELSKPALKAQKIAQRKRQREKRAKKKYGRAVEKEAEDGNRGGESEDKREEKEI
ncbi:uncharacterized protein VTP21DRAFT_3312 [Calcarisporiella thermophila]|uniref:uncharacterized protein n=1 Tax=Calcarisporiella thermophila TaxID=911321 RepID=UPI0037441A84